MRKLVGADAPVRPARRRRGTPFRMHRKCHFYSDAVTVPSATISFPSCGKRYGRKGRWDAFYSADAQKNNPFRCAYFRYTFRSPNALRATVESGSCIARQTTQVVMLAPVEYLTYEIRNISDLMRLVGTDAHIDPHSLAGAARPTEAQSISTTSPVYPNSHLHRVLSI